MFYKCMKLEDGDEEKCAPYARAYRSICPSDWYERGRGGGGSICGKARRSVDRQSLLLAFGQGGRRAVWRGWLCQQ